MVGPPWKLEPYPFAALDDAKDAAIASGIDIIDFGMGDPREPTPAFIREALSESLTHISSYPRAAGLPALREAIAQWFDRRYDVSIDAATQIMPTLGAKEIIHSLPAYLLREGKDTIIVPSPAYPVYERGAKFHGAQVYEMPLLADNQFLPDLDAIPAEVLDRAMLLWLNYPNNPTGFTAPLSLYEKAARLAQQHDMVFASDEAYSEIWFETKPVSALQIRNVENVVVINTLSKRSCMTGYRSGFIAGDSRVIDRLRTYRPSVGVTPQEFVQRASIEAWNEEDHVETFRQLWQTKRAILNAALGDKGVEAQNDATFYLWVPVPHGYTSASLAAMLIQHGLVVTPGAAFGPAGEGYVRFATVPTVEDCERAALLIKELSF